MAIKGFNVPGTPSGWLAIAFRKPARYEWIIDGTGKPMQWNWDYTTQWFVIIRKIDLNEIDVNEQELEAEYRDCQCEAVWFERLLVVGAVAIGLAVLYFCGALEWIEG